jgi:hypothetical protein
MREQNRIAVPHSGLLPADPNVRALCWILIITSVAAMATRLWSVEKVSYERRVPFLSANDRSRWCTIRALGDHDTYVIDEVLQGDGGRSWDTIDKVLHWGRDNRPHFYSSKPPFQPTLLAWLYKGINLVTGWNLVDNTFEVVRWMLLLTQVLPSVVLIWMTARIGEFLAKTTFARVFVVAVAAFGTYITTFSVTLNNHVPAAICVAASLYGLIVIRRQPEVRWPWYFQVGLTSSLAAAFELPAASWMVVAMFVCLPGSFRKTVVAFLPPALLVIAGFLATNYQAHGELQPAYSHREDGKLIATHESPSPEISEALARGEIAGELREILEAARSDLRGDWLDTAVVFPGGWSDSSSQSGTRFIVWFDRSREPLVIVVAAEGNRLDVRRWSNWYEYPGSYWLQQNKARSRVDQGERNPWKYLFHLTVGHHGVFVLTPVWLLSLWGLVSCLRRPNSPYRIVAAGIACVSVVLFAFYVMRPFEDRNYGGLCSAPRWFFWLGPLWLASMIPALDKMAGTIRWTVLALVLLAISVASAFSASGNPWVHPWIYRWLGLE